MEETESLEESVIGLVRAICSWKKEEMGISDRLTEDLGIDSLEMFALSANLESNFHVNIMDRLTEAVTVGDLIHIVSDEMNSPKHDKSKIISRTIADFPLPKTEENIRFLHQFYSISEMLWDFEISGVENVPRNSKVILCPNHESYFDALWVSGAMWQNGFDINDFSCLAADHLMRNKMMKKAFTALGGIPVNRTGNTMPAIERALKCLNRGKCIMLIHPEGTRSRDGKLGQFKLGAAELSKRSGVNIVPVCINGAYEIFPPYKRLPRLFDWKHFCKYPLQIKFGTPISPDNKIAKEIIGEIKRQIVTMKNK